MCGANTTPHVAPNDTNRSSAIDGRTTRHAGYRTSQTIHERTEECFFWLETIGRLRKSRFTGRDKLDFHLALGAAVYNLVRIRNPKVVTW